MSENKYYDFNLPIFKVGDDLGYQLEKSASTAEAFKNLAAQYEECVRLCRIMASVAVEVPELEVQADCHYVGVSGPEDKLKPLVDDDVLSVSPFEEYEEDEEDD